MTESILFSFSILFALWGLYSYLGFRTSKKDWSSKVKEWYPVKKRDSFIMRLGKRYDESNRGKEVKAQLLRANLPLAPSEFFGILFVGGLGVAVILFSVFNIGFPVNIITAVILMEVARRVLFYLRKNKYQERLNQQLPEICRVLANATRSGMTLTQAFHLATKELDQPARDEFIRLSNELQLGVDFDRALKKMQLRVPSREFKLFVATILIQKTAGGNIHAVLDEMGKTLEERKLLLQEIKTLTAEQKMIAYILPAVPVFLLLIMNTIIDGFIDPLFTGIGMILLIIFVLGMAFTFLLIKKVTNIRV